MRMTKAFTTACIAIAAAGMLAAASVDTDQDAAKKKVKIGEEVPNFTLTDTKGNEVSLADFKEKTVVIEWYNPGCPYCKKVYGSGLVAETVKAMKKMGDDYVYIAINSTGDMPKEDVIAQSDKLMKDSKLEIPILIDHDGAVGRMFDARTTPHMFVIDPGGVLRYHGAYTNDPNGREENPTNYVLDALGSLAEGETVTPDYVKPWGCNVKFARTDG